MFTPVWKSNIKMKSKTLRQVVFGCLKEGDYETLDKLLLSRSTRDIEKFYAKETASLLHLTLTSLSFSSDSLKYVVSNIPSQFCTPKLKKNNFSLLNSFISVCAERRQGNEYEKNKSEKMIEKLKILLTIDDIELKNFLEEALLILLQANNEPLLEY